MESSELKGGINGTAGGAVESVTSDCINGSLTDDITLSTHDDGELNAFQDAQDALDMAVEQMQQQAFELSKDSAERAIALFDAVSTCSFTPPHAGIVSYP